MKINPLSDNHKLLNTTLWARGMMYSRDVTIKFHEHSVVFQGNGVDVEVYCWLNGNGSYYWGAHGQVWIATLGDQDKYHEINISGDDLEDMLRRTVSSITESLADRQ